MSLRPSTRPPTFTQRRPTSRLESNEPSLHRTQGGSVTVAQWSERWLEHVRYRRDALGDLRANTAASYERLTRVHVVCRLEAVRLAQLTPGHVERA